VSLIEKLTRASFPRPQAQFLPLRATKPPRRCRHWWLSLSRRAGRNPRYAVRNLGSHSQ